MQKNIWWKVRHSFWIVFAFVWFINWVPFLYIGIRTNKKKWILSSIGYMAAGVSPFFINSHENPQLFNVFMVIFLLAWLFGIVHAFLIRKEVLLIIASTEKSRDEELKERIEKEYDVRIDQDEDNFKNEMIEGLSDIDRARVSEIGNLMTDIYELLRLIKLKSKDRDKFLIVSTFMDNIKEYEDALPVLGKNFRDGLLFVSKYSNVQQEIIAFEQKVKQAEGPAREIYEKALNEKKDTLEEINKIKSSLAETESKLYLILSVLQKIEAVLEASKLSEDLSNEEVSTLNSYLETFAENIKGTLKSIGI